MNKAPMYFIRAGKICAFGALSLALFKLGATESLSLEARLSKGLKLVRL